MRAPFSRLDPEDDFTRFIERLRENRGEYANIIISGGLTPEQYAAYCARVAQIDDTLALARQIRRGEDLNPPKPEPLRSVEE